MRGRVKRNKFEKFLGVITDNSLIFNTQSNFEENLLFWIKIWLMINWHLVHIELNRLNTSRLTSWLTKELEFPSNTKYSN